MAKKYRDWIPEPELQFHLWQGTFMTEIQDPVINPLTGIPTAKLDVLLDLQAAYEAAFAAAPPHAYNGKLLNKARSDARKAYISGPGGIRKIAAQYLRHNEELSLLQKIQIGIKVAKETYTQTSLRADTNYSDVTVKSSTPGTVTFTFHGQGTSPSRGKEAGMHHCLVEYVILPLGQPPPASPDDCTKHVEMQKSPYTKDVTMINSGMRLWGFAAWVDTRGVQHAWSAVFGCVIT